MSEDKIYPACPVCDYDEPVSSWHGICAQCGFHFAYEDSGPEGEAFYHACAREYWKAGNNFWPNTAVLQQMERIRVLEQELREVKDELIFKTEECINKEGELRDQERKLKLATEALTGLLNNLPSQCSCDEAYTSREKALGYSFKDPDCLFCDLGDSLSKAEAALKEIEKFQS